MCQIGKKTLGNGGGGLGEILCEEEEIGGKMGREKCGWVGEKKRERDGERGQRVWKWGERERGERI